MESVIDFIERHEGQQKAILEYLHDLLTDEFGLTPRIKYHIPFYYGNSWICYLNPGKKHTVDFAFVRGQELANSSGLLSGEGRKMVASVRLNNMSEIPYEAILETIQEAIILDETQAYSLKKQS